MIQLGISAFYHDAAACIVKDGTVLAAAEEERFTEIKHDSSFPINAINWCLEYCKLTLQDIDEVDWYEIPDDKKDRVLTTFRKRWWKTRKLKKKFLQDIKINDPVKILREMGYRGDIVYMPHHLAHAAFSYLTSPIQEAAILSVDGVGEWDTVSIWRGIGDDIQYVYGVQFPNSLGLLYSAITAYLGFKPNEGEYKVMGLAPYGDPNTFYSKLSEVFDPAEELKLNMKYFSWEYDERVMYNVELAKLLEVLPRLPEEPVEQAHKDLAAALQKIYEREFLKLVDKAKKMVGTDNLCLSGGCAYNGVANAKAYKYFNHIHIPFAPSDAGSAIGACLYNYEGPRKDNSSPYLGPGSSEYQIKKVLDSMKVKYKLYQDDNAVCAATARYIGEGKIVAWFQGRMEFGARALGNRSILANSTIPDMRKKLNLVIKKREGFRPFAPSVLKSHQGKYCNVVEDVQYMNQVVTAKGKEFPSATHIDGTARVHTVTEEQNSKYALLLKHVGNVTGHPVVLNTSFNLKDQTITISPKQAVERYLSSDIDVLVIENFIITKNDNRVFRR